MAYRISDLLDASPLDGTETFEINQGGDSRKMLLSSISGAGAIRIVEDIGTLRTTEGQHDGEVIMVAGYYSNTPGQGGGEFRWDATNTIADDSGVTFSVTGLSTGRWLRIHTRIEPPMFGAVPIPGVDRTAALQAMRDYLAAQLLPSGCVFTAGIYEYSVSPNWAISDAQISTEGEVRLRYTGSGNAVIIDAGAVTGNCYNLRMKYFIVEAPATSQNGVFVRSVHHSVLGFRDLTAGTTFSGIRVEFAVCTKFESCATTGNVAGFYGSAQPKYGLFLTRRGNGETTSYCQFENPIFELVDIGVHTDWTLGNTFQGGTFEACTTRGLETTANSLRDVYDKVDFEANGVRDIVCLGRQIEFRSCDTTLSVFLAGSNNRMFGGNHESIEIDPSGIQNSLSCLLYRRNSTGTLIDGGQQTNMRDLVRVDAGGSTFTRHNAIPNRLTPAVGATPFTYTNNTGNDITVSVTGGIVNNLALSRPGFSGTALGATSGTFLLSPKDSIVIDHSGAPNLVVLSR